MRDIDAKIAGKEAEYENLSRATATLLEQHTKLREDFDEEMTKRAQKAEKQLDKDLKDTRAMLKSAEKDLEKAKSGLIKTIQEAESTRQGALEALEAVSRDKSVLEGVIGELTAQRLSLEAEIKVHSSELTDITTTTAARQTELSEVERTLATRKEDLDNLEQEILDAELTFSAERSSWEKEEEDLRHRLSNLHAQLDEASRQLVETQNHDESIRSDLAERTVRLDKRESTLEAREAKIAQQEKRLYNYSKFTGL